jgi:hypothetical protein
VRIGTVGPFAWFSGHFPENWQTDPNIFCQDVDEGDYRFLINIINFRPNITLFYRPELYPKRYLEEISGIKVAFLSEPVPPLHDDGTWVRTPETDLRLKVYSRMSWGSFHRIFYYDKAKERTVRLLRWPISDFRPMPIDLSVFNSNPIEGRPIDVFFIGKPTPHRISQLDFLRTAKLNYQWVAHGLSGARLAQTLRRSKVVLNIHADALPATEPRIHLSAACGCIVLSETVDGDLSPFEDRVIEFEGALKIDHIYHAIEKSRGGDWSSKPFEERLSAKRFVSECAVAAGLSSAD